jgi:integrase
MSVEDQERERRSRSSLPVMAVPAVVAAAAGNGNRSASSVSLASSPSALERVESTPAPSDGQIYLVRMDVVRRRLQKRGLSAQVIELLLASSRSSTATAYQSAWGNWCRWNLAKSLDPLSNSLNNILQYLNDLFRSGLASQTINSHRSMLSMTLDPIDGHNIVEHPLVVQLLKGCYNLKPPRARYNVMWDPDVVLKYFISLPENKDLSFTIASHKLATLIALACLLRIGEIAAISFSSIHISDTAASFSISRPRKTQHLGPLRSFSLPRLSGPTCPVDCLEDYLNRTTPLRNKDVDILFISLKRPHKPVGSSTLGRWIKQCLISAGVNGDFGAHSTRGSAASKAARAGVSIDQILKAASWSSELVFDRFYHRDCSNDDVVATNVLTQSSSHL